MADEDRFAGKGDQIAGKAKEVGGKLTGDEELEAEGKTQRVSGKVEEKLHEAAEKVKGVVDRLRRHDGGEESA